MNKKIETSVNLIFILVLIDGATQIVTAAKYTAVVLGSIPDSVEFILYFFLNSNSASFRAEFQYKTTLI